MTTKSAAERKAAERARKRESGLVKIELWVKPEKIPEIKAFSQSLDKTAAIRGDSR